MTEKPDKLLLLYIGSAVFILCAGIGTAALFLLPRLFALLAVLLAAAIFTAAAFYLVLFRKHTVYRLERGRLMIVTGVMVKRTSCLYLDRVTVVNRYSLPAGVKFMTVHVLGGSALILTGKIKI